MSFDFNNSIQVSSADVNIFDKSDVGAKFKQLIEDCTYYTCITMIEDNETYYKVVFNKDNPRFVNTFKQDDIILCFTLMYNAFKYFTKFIKIVFDKTIINYMCKHYDPLYVYIINASNKDTAYTFVKNINFSNNNRYCIIKNYNIHAIINCLQYLNACVYEYQKENIHTPVIISLQNEWAPNDNGNSYYTEIYPFKQNDLLTLFNTICANKDLFSNIRCQLPFITFLKNSINKRFKYKSNAMPDAQYSLNYSLYDVCCAFYQELYNIIKDKSNKKYSISKIVDNTIPIMGAFNIL